MLKKKVSKISEQQQQLYFFVQKDKSWIVCSANSWKAISHGGARQVHK